MSAVPSGSTGHHQWIPLSKLSPSPLNHRKTFNKEKMEELTASVLARGVIQPILARPRPDDKFEVVAGERRYRAAKSAKLVDIPAIVRELTDVEVLELQVIENGQRVDPHPLEEAEGYEALMQCPRADGTTYNADEIAAKVGKSRAYVYGRLKLLALCPAGREAFYEGTLDASRALLLARIPVAELQEKALEEILNDQYSGEPMSYRDASDHIQNEYMLRLKDAPFKTADPDLVPAAGPCTTCPKRSGNQPELFGDIKGADLCTDPKCFSLKRAAAFEIVKEKAVSKGQEVVVGKAAKGVVKLDDHCQDDSQYRTYREILGKQAPTPVLVADTRGETPVLVEAVRKADIAAILEKKKIAPRARPKADQGPSEEEIFRERIFMHVCANLPTTLGEVELRWLVPELLMGDCDPTIVQRLLLPTGKDEKQAYGVSQALIEKALPKLDAEALSRLVVAVFLSSDLERYSKGERLMDAAKRYGVDVAGVRAAVKAEIKAKAKAKPEEAVVEDA